MTSTERHESSNILMPSITANAVFRIQAVIAAAVTTIAIVYVAAAQNVPEIGIIIGGVALLFLLSLAAAVIDWDRLDPRVSMVLPLVDIVAIAIIREGAPAAGFGVMMVFPTAWLASSYGRVGAISGPSLAAVCLVSLYFIDIGVGPGTEVGLNLLPALFSIPIALMFLSGTIYVAQQRITENQELVDRQRESVNLAFDAARSEQKALRTILDTVDFCVVQLDPSGRIIRVNQALRSAFADMNLTLNDSLAELPLYRSDGVTPLVLESNLLDRVLAGEPINRSVLWAGDPGDHRRAYSISIATVRDRQDAITSIVIVGHDVSAELRAVRARDDLVASVSHELRTPLTSILGYLELAHDEADPSSAARRHLEVALRNTDHLMTLVNDLLTARTRDPQAAVVLELAETDVTQLITDAVEAIRPTASEQRVTVEARLPHVARIQADTARLRQVIDNVLSNAVKYNKIGGSIDVEVRLIAPDDETRGIEIKISDTGHGMPEEDLEHVFDRFYRAESVRGSKIHGTGLGLSISRDIVRRHGGSLDMTSEPDAGTTVTIRLSREVPARNRSTA